MADQESAHDTGAASAPRGVGRARRLLRLTRGRRGAVWATGLLLLAAIVVTVELTPGTSSGFSAVINNSQNTVGTAPNFSASGGVLPYSDGWAGGDTGWIDYGGTWTTASTASGATYTESAGGGAGNKAISGQTSWTDYTLQGDVKILSGTQAGLVFRVTNPGVGADTLNGYYLGLYTSGTMTLGRENNSYASLKSSTYAVSTNTWYHLAVQVVGCVITASVVQVGATPPVTPTYLSYTDTGCPTSGAIGVRDYASTAAFRNITATAGGTTSTTIAPYYAPFANVLTPQYGQTTYGGLWTASSANETYTDNTGGQGDKSVMGLTTWGNYSLTGDVQLNSSATTSTSSGFIVRVVNPSNAVNGMTGYYAGVSSTSLVLVDINSGTATTMATAALPATLGTNTWYHLTVEAVGCTITATAQLKTGSALTVASATDSTSCQTTGAVGVRTIGTSATWRDVAVTPR
ncbi:family 16 glycoside hydrolase [Frondihabitans australicus]|uniref:Uncharacterized protein DUF1080 n=1 Tax=Frondihabitans australicus TaxID=386892 RepID=A0A495IHA0_9MICO|nr:family 16 glycoside hydrolase [Frondihabitans australicus]RKR74525.1 uncharacterized protein DUF1080 [Frondihabitans australicus]